MQTARLVRVPLDGPAEPHAVARWLRGEPRPVALSGEWAGGGLILTSHPLRRGDERGDAFALLDDHPDTRDREGDGVGGGWFGWLGFGLGRELEPVPPPPPRPLPLPPFDLAYHDHLVRCDAGGRWWFEALWTQARGAALEERLGVWRKRLAKPAPAGRDARAEPLRVVAPGAAGHAVAVAEAIERIAAGEIFQANLCLRLEAALRGDLLDAWVRGVQTAGPAYAAYVGGEGHAVASLSPELFLRRTGRHVTSSPIKGTSTDPGALARSPKDRAENVMIVDLMRNDLGRVCEFGSVEVAELFEVRPASGVWHLVSTVTGTLPAGTGDAALLRATFPPGSVTGAPKIRSLRVISELEATAREAYCGAIGFCSPVAGLELNVAIRTFEARAGRVWLGAGGGVVSDSSPGGEVAEALAKARGTAAAAGIPFEGGAAVTGGEPPPLVDHPRPDPARGVFETVLVRDGRPVRLADHLARLAASCAALGLAPAADLEERVRAAAQGSGRLRILVDAAGTRVETGPLPDAGPVALRPATLPGGLGAHKWTDRGWIEAAGSPLICDLDGEVLEAGHASVLIVERGVLTAPPLDGRQLASVSRAHTLATAHLPVRIERLELGRVLAADALVLTTALRGPHAGVVPGGPPEDASRAAAAALHAHHPGS